MRHLLQAIGGALEREVLRGLLAIPETEIDPGRSSIDEGPERVVCRFVSQGDRHCPFELHFGRGSHRDSFSFFIGKGADFANLEPLATAEDAAGLSEDVALFLSSKVRCERHSSGTRIVREDYYPSRMTAGASPLRLTYKSGSLVQLLTASKATVVYSPWLSAAPTSS